MWVLTGTPGTHVLTGSAVSSCWLWNCETGEQLALLKANSAFRTCGFDFGSNIIVFSTDKQMGYQCLVSFFDLQDPSQIDSKELYVKVQDLQCGLGTSGGVHHHRP